MVVACGCVAGMSDRCTDTYVNGEKEEQDVEKRKAIKGMRKTKNEVKI